MGRTLDIHPLVVLVVTALGGFLAGIVGLILAVPFTVIAGNAIGRLRSGGFFDVVADRAEPTVKIDARLRWAARSAHRGPGRGTRDPYGRREEHHSA